MSDNYGMRVGESLVAGGPPGTAAEPDIVGNLNGPFGTAFATLLEINKGTYESFAIMNTDIMVRLPL